MLLRVLTAILFLVVLSGVALRAGKLSRYMFDIERKSDALETRRASDDDEFGFHRYSAARHNCLTAYVIAADLARRGVENLYQKSYYRGTDVPTRYHIQIADQLTIDRYQYPPQFLLLPHALTYISTEFMTIRSIWFCLNLSLLLVAMLAVGRWCGGKWLSLETAVCLLPLTAPTVLIALQYGNAHVYVLAAAMIGMLLIETGRERSGGALLAVAVVSKVFPAILLVYLAVRRRWRAIAWAVSALAVVTLLSVAVHGTHPIEAFLSFQLPRLANADAFDFVRARSRPIAVNMSAYGIPFKLDELGMSIDNRLVWATFCASCQTVATLLAALFCGLRAPNPMCQDGDTDLARRCRVREAAMWLVMLILAQQQSPYLPWDYGTIAPLWLLTLLLPARRVWYRRLLPITLLWLWMAMPIPLPFGANTYPVANFYVLVGCVLILACCAGAVGLRIGLLQDSARVLADQALHRQQVEAVSNSTRTPSP